MTSAPDVAHAPGCFGSALCFDAGSAECRTCPFVSTCGPRAAERQDMLRARFGLPVKTKTVAVKAATETPGAEGLAVPKKVEELLERFQRAGISVTDKLAKGENPFATTPAFMRVTCHLLLNLEQGMTRDMLRMALQKKLNWSQGTAHAHAIQAAQALVALGAATENNGRLALRRH